MPDLFKLGSLVCYLAASTAVACNVTVVTIGADAAGSSGSATASGGANAGSGAGAGTGIPPSGGGGAPTASSGTAGAGGDGGSAPSVACDGMGSLVLQGTLNGQPFPLTNLSVGGAGNISAGLGNIAPAPDGLVAYRVPPNTSLSQVTPMTGVLFMPAGTPEAHTWFAFGPGSTVVETAGDFALNLEGIRKLGTCPAPQGSGSLSYCTGVGPGDCGSAAVSTTGSVDGATFDWGSTPSNSLGGYIAWTNGASLAWVASDMEHFVSGVLLMPPTGPDPSAYYCVGSWTASGNTAIFGNLTRLGTAAEAKPAGALAGCFGGV
jgi:hypothetical protein